ncbi:unnamed protein product [Larinioides sclopetarius]|uniref:Uncharacterized protein n=1 Tax=Larinioides sclopetarius TaxID=280406 RepID=A0AAV2BWY4_9ARAC
MEDRKRGIIQGNYTRKFIGHFHWLKTRRRGNFKLKSIQTIFIFLYLYIFK